MYKNDVGSFIYVFICQGGDARTDVRLQEDAQGTPERASETGRKVQIGDGKPQEPSGQGVRDSVADVQQGFGKVTGNFCI